MRSFRHNWSNIKKALQYLINQDEDSDGILSGSQHNTLDANWFGPVAWLTGLYLAALRAGEEMATEAGDDAFARQCRTIFQNGTKKHRRTAFRRRVLHQQARPPNTPRRSTPAPAARSTR